VNVEAMNFSKPVVGTVFGGTPEVVEHGVTGYVENPFDVETFAKRVTELLGDPGRRRAMGEAGLLRLRERFAMPRLARDMAAIYGELRAQGARGAAPAPATPERGGTAAPSRGVQGSGA
jgi:glycosyltransferase involved in cell wall biosynthesis